MSRRSPSLALLVGLCLAALLAAGCASSPVVRAVQAQRVAQSADAVAVQITLELTNPNEFPLELLLWEYSATVNGRHVYEGRWMASLTLPPKTPMITQLPVVISAQHAADLADARWSIGGSVGYRNTRQIDRLLYQIGIHRLTAGFSTHGQAIGKAADERTTEPSPAPDKPLT